MSNKTGIIRTIYLYLFSLVGLILIIIAGVRFIDMGLKAWVFTNAESPRYEAPPRLSVAKDFAPLEEEAVLSCSDTCGFSEEEKKLAQEWLVEYQTWLEQDQKIDYVSQNRQRTAASSLAMLIIGAPLYVYHWRLASRRKRDED